MSMCNNPELVKQTENLVINLIGDEIPQVHTTLDIFVHFVAVVSLLVVPTLTLAHTVLHRGLRQENLNK